MMLPAWNNFPGAVRNAMRRARPRLRILLGIGTLLIILYFILSSFYLYPDMYPRVMFKNDGTGVVIESMAAEPVPGHPEVREILPGDILLAVDGIPFRKTDLRLLIGPPAESHAYELQRGDLRYSVIIPSGDATSVNKINFFILHFILLAMWTLGFAILMFSPPENDQAWLTGLVFLGYSLAGTAWWDTGIPGSIIGFTALANFAGIGLMAVTVWAGSPGALKGRRIFRILEALAVVLAAMAFVEVFFLFPGSSWDAITGYGTMKGTESGGLLWDIATYILEITAVGAVAIMVVQRILARTRKARQQTTILMIASAISVLPPILAYHLAVTNPDSILFEYWGLTMVSFIVLPAAYGYVILRYRYLKLDFMVSRGMSMLLAAAAVSFLYYIGSEAVERVPELAPLQPVFGMIILLAGFWLVARAGGPVQRGLEVLLFGPSRPLQTALEKLTANLSSDPQISTLREELLQVIPKLLGVRRAGLLLLESQDQSGTPGGLVSELNFSPADLETLTDLQLRQVAPEAAIFRKYPWAELAAPLRIGKKVIGVYLLGGKVPEGEFDTQEITFLRQAASAAAIAAENAQLFEALQEVAQERLRVRQAERLDLAARLHDEPLQQAAAVSISLDRLLLEKETLTDDQAGLVRRQAEEVRSLAGTLRDICGGLRPPILDQGLELTLRETVQVFRNRWPGVKIELLFPASADRNPPLSPEAMDATYHIVTESLTNAGRHACATRVQVAVLAAEDHVEISVTDDGSGVSATRQSLPDLLRAHHFGLAGMNHWAAMAGGRLEILPAIPHGTRVILTLPQVSD